MCSVALPNIHDITGQTCPRAGDIKEENFAFEKKVLAIKFLAIYP